MTRAAAPFWSRVDRSGGCWPWLGYVMPSGYGQTTVDGRNVYAHRHAWELAAGRTILDGHFVAHLCSNRACARPEHLEERPDKACRVKHAPVEKRFWSKVEKTDGCWLWKASYGTHGYGQFRWRGRMQPASRVAWEMANGPVPGRLYVCHHCDNRSCVRLEHLFLGTATENMQDASRKGRTTRGELDAMAKLTEVQVREIRELYAAGGVTQRQLAGRFGVRQMCISRVISRKRWAHVA